MRFPDLVVDVLIVRISSGSVVLIKQANPRLIEPLPAGTMAAPRCDTVACLSLFDLRKVRQR
jgi:hypothetical protein